MSKFELKLPKMGESVAEATITSWLKEIGDQIEMDEAVLEIATDKVDTEVPCEFEGVLIEKCFEVDEIVQVGQTIAIIEVEGKVSSQAISNNNEDLVSEKEDLEIVLPPTFELKEDSENQIKFSDSDRFYSPLVKNIIKKEGIDFKELEKVKGSGKDNRINKNDILKYIESKSSSNKIELTPVKVIKPSNIQTNLNTLNNSNDEVVEMSRMGKLVSKHMIDSVKTSAHVQSFIEVDVTKVWNWRNKVKSDFAKREGEKLTLTPIFMQAVAVALRTYPMMNVSVVNDNIILKKSINIGMATSLADGNLIVPVIKNADRLNLVGMTKSVNELANKARSGKLNPDDVQDGTYTVTNVGVFGSIMGTPIINQPQVGILALGAIRKMPSVIETSEGDFIGIRNKMFLSHSYDHRVVNGGLGSQFIKCIKEYLEAWDVNTEI
ncbi:MAG: dihydrolipoamide acetyltransferase family protein [Flavobacteriaceae bacterium]|nr:dihydrolipoamide acetyltransferase family protein [Flavobacteriaceae bacterium]CAI8337154.1 MAG: Dihydrolipoyllysine-residue succinyltransferase component of 2-oxoglutarate dehydrogenase complex [Flavobacteriaceae bacterium]